MCGVDVKKARCGWTKGREGATGRWPSGEKARRPSNKEEGVAMG